MRKELGRLILLKEVTVLEEHDTVRDLSRESHLVGDHHHGHLLLRKILHDVQNFSDHLRIQRGGRLVEKHDFRSHAECPDNGDTLLLSAGQLARIGVGTVRETDLPQKIQRVLLRLLFLEALQLRGCQRQVPHDIHMREQVELLEHHTHSLTVLVDVRLRIADVDSVKNDLAAGGLLEPVQAAEEGGFSGAGGADDADHIALLDIDRNVLQNFVIPKCLAEIPDLDDGLRCSRTVFILSAHSSSASFPAASLRGRTA